MSNDTSDNKQPTKALFRIHLWGVASLCLIAHVGFADVGSIGVGLEGGMSTLNRVSNNPPDTINGGMVGVLANYAFNDEFGVSLEGDLHIQGPYDILVRGLVPVDDTAPEGKGDMIVDWIKGPHIKRSFVSSVTLSGLYFIEILTLRPYIVAGIAGIRSDLEYDFGQSTGYALGLRVGIGTDYLLMDKIGIGAIAQSDIFVIGASSYYTRLAFSARVTYFFGPVNN